MYEKHSVRTNKKWSLLMLILLALALCLNGATTIAQEPPGNDGPFTEMSVEVTLIEWKPLVEHSGLVLLVTFPGGIVYRQEFGPGSIPTLEPIDAAGDPFPDGDYTYELRAVSADSDAGANAPMTTLAEFGRFTVLDGEFVADGSAEHQNQPAGPLAPADIVHNDDVIAQFSMCIGNDCVNGESFGFDTLRLKENNLRIKFQDTSTSASFPSNDWQITANDSQNGGANKFSIDDISGGRTPFTIEASAPSHSLYVEDSGQVGLGTNEPVLDLHIKGCNTPGVRLHQDSSCGWTSQTWDVSGNEVNFFIRDATDAKLPFRIRSGAQTSSIEIESDSDIKFVNGKVMFKSDGKVGIGTQAPDGIVDVEADNATLYINTTNDNAGGEAYARFEVQRNSSRIGTFGKILGNVDRFGIKLGSGSDLIIQNSSGATILWGTESSGDVGIGKTNPGYKLEVDGTAGKPGGGSWSNSSDARLKENVNAIDGREALDLLSQLQGVTFEWANPEEHSAGTRAGLLAQDLEKVFPDWVDEYKAQGSDAALIPEGEMALAIHFPHDFNAYLIEAIKALDAENAALQQQNADLEARVATLEALVESLLQAQSE